MRKSVSVVYTAQAVKDLQYLDKALVKRLMKKVSENVAMPDPLARAKALRGNFLSMYRYRVGDYRAVFVMDNNKVVTLITIVTIKHRKDVYR